jgi:hypothetical protein
MEEKIEYSKEYVDGLDNIDLSILNALVEYQTDHVKADISQEIQDYVKEKVKSRIDSRLILKDLIDEDVEIVKKNKGKYVWTATWETD